MEAHAIYSDIKQGNLASFEWFYKKYHPRAYVFCKKILGDEDEAKDVTQESFILFWEYRNRIESPETLCSYLFQILKTQCLKQIRRNALQNNFSNLTDTKLKELELSYYTKEKNVLEDLYFKELDENFQKALEQLPQQCRLVVQMNNRQGMKSSEIAEELNLSIRTVENHLYRGLKVIRASLTHFLPLLF